MRPLLCHIRLIIAGALMFAASLASAQDPAPAPMAWQAAVTGQIEAFRHGDAPEAFAFAGAAFQTGFPNAAVFFETIVGSGYAPIMTSTSHSFGDFAPVGEDGTVAQVVKFVGPNQERYEALYQMREEPAGWRVQGVLLRKAKGIGI